MAKDICFQTFNAQWQLNPDTCFPDTCFHKESRHLLPNTCFHKESRHLFPDTCFQEETRHLFPDTCFHQETRHLFPDTCFLESYPDTCFPTPVSSPKNQTPVSRHLFPSKKMLVLKYDKASLNILYNGKEIFCLKVIACSKEFAYPNSWIGKFIISCVFLIPWIGSLAWQVVLGVNKLLKTKSLLTSPSNVLPYYFKLTFPPIL